MSEKSYIIESDFKHQGIRCIVVAYDMGHRCGYCQVEKGHILYGKGYSQNVPKLKHLLEKVYKMPVNEAIDKKGAINVFLRGIDKKAKTKASPDILLSAHGGITYAGPAKHLELDGWWFGFDCAHADDARDKSIMSAKMLEEFSHATLLFKGTIRTKEYVEEECKKLAEQLIIINKEG